MPINADRRGFGGRTIARPGSKHPGDSSAFTLHNYDEPFRSVQLARTNLTLSGVSRDSAGVALGNCTIKIFRTSDDQKMAETTSDGSGNWSLTLNLSGPFYIVAYKVGSPDVAGTSVNTLNPV